MAEQLDLFVNNERQAWPTQRSATGVIARTAKRLGYDWCAMCAHCGQLVILAGEWRPAGWVHRDSGAAACRVRDLAQRSIYASIYRGGLSG